MGTCRDRFVGLKYTTKHCLKSGYDIALFIVDVSLCKKSVKVSQGLCIIFVNYIDLFSCACYLGLLKLLKYIT